METPETQALACRRIDFYRRQGARLLGGIRYIQKAASHLPDLYLRLMAHPLGNTGPQEAFDCAKTVLAGAISQTGALRWE